MGYKYGYPTYNPTYNYPMNLQVAPRATNKFDKGNAATAKENGP